MNPAAKICSISLKKNEVTSPGDRSDQMRNASMMQRLASAYPNDRRAARINFADSFVGNGMAGIVMQNFSRVHKLNGAGVRGRTHRLCKPGSGEVRRKPQGQP